MFPVYDVIQRSTQAPVIVIFNRDEAEGLQHAIVHLPRWAQNFGHAVHRPCLRLKCNLDEVTLRQRLGQLQQAPGHGDGLEFSFGAPAVF